MSPNTSHQTADELLEKWYQLDVVDSQDHRKLTDFIVARQQQPELPLYLRALIGVGAFLTSLFFMAFLLTVGFIDFENPYILLIWGGGFIVSAIILLRWAEQGVLIRHSFYLQSSFAFMAVGKTLFVMGASQIFESDWGISGALVIVISLTYFVYRMSIDRYLSVLALCLSILINILFNEDNLASQSLLFHLFFCAQLAAAAFLLTSGRVKYAYMPIAYALLSSLSVCVLYLAAQLEIIQNFDQQQWIQIGYINILLIIALWALVIWVAGGLRKWRKHPLIIAVLAILILGAISAPGILWAIGLMILGYGRHDRLLIVAGALMFPLFLWLYYYNLDITLMQKSLILVSSGAILLAGRFYLIYQGWHAGNTESAIAQDQGAGQ